MSKILGLLHASIMPHECLSEGRRGGCLGDGRRGLCLGEGRREVGLGEGGEKCV